MHDFEKNQDFFNLSSTSFFPFVKLSMLLDYSEIQNLLRSFLLLIFLWFLSHFISCSPTESTWVLVMCTPTCQEKPPWNIAFLWLRKSRNLSFLEFFISMSIPWTFCDSPLKLSCVYSINIYIYISWIFILNRIYYIINWIYKDVTEWLDKPLGKKKTVSTRLCQYVVGAQETFLSSRPYFCHFGFVFYLILILWLLWWECSTGRTWGVGERVSKATLVRWDNFLMMYVHFLNVFAALMLDNKTLLPWLNYFTLLHLGRTQK